MSKRSVSKLKNQLSHGWDVLAVPEGLNHFRIPIKKATHLTITDTVYLYGARDNDARLSPGGVLSLPLAHAHGIGR